MHKHMHTHMHTHVRTYVHARVRTHVRTCGFVSKWWFRTHKWFRANEMGMDAVSYIRKVWLRAMVFWSKDGY